MRAPAARCPKSNRRWCTMTAGKESRASAGIPVPRRPAPASSSPSLPDRGGLSFRLIMLPVVPPWPASSFHERGFGGSTHGAGGRHIGCVLCDTAASCHAPRLQ